MSPLKYMLEKFPVFAIGLSTLVMMQVLLSSSQAATKQEKACNANSPRFEFALMKQAEKHKIPINRYTTRYFSFGSCDSHAYLQLEDGRSMVFNLAFDTLYTRCPIEVSSRLPGTLSNHMDALADRERWQHLLNSSNFLTDDFRSCHIYAFEHDGKLAILGRSWPHSLSDPLGVLSYQGATISIKHFLTTNYSQFRYQKDLLDVWRALRYAPNSIVVAGDQGLVVQGAQQEFLFAEYGKLKSMRKICNYSDLRKRMEAMPTGVYSEEYLSAHSSAIDVHRALAQYVNRQPLRAIAFGCD